MPVMKSLALGFEPNPG